MKNFSTSSFVIGVMFGMLLAYAWFFRENLVQVPLLSSSLIATSTGTTLLQTQESNSVSVVNQSAGDSVTVESVTVPPPGVWVAVREMNGTELGNVLGALRVNGPRSAVVVPLLRATEPARSYAVELYRDDGNGEFNLATLSVYVDFATGAPVIVYFTTAN